MFGTLYADELEMCWYPLLRISETREFKLSHDFLY